MDRGIQLLLLSGVVATALLFTPDAQAQSQPPAGVGATDENPQVVQPEVQRRQVRPAKIDAENFEAGLFAGTLGIEDFGSSVVYGGRLAYHFTEDVFAEAFLGTSKAGKTSYEDLSGAAQLLTDSQRQYTYYDLSIGWNALPGEVFLGGKRAMPSDVYVTLGAGSTRFAGDDHFTVALGAGLRLLVTDWLAVHLDARDHMFDSDLLGKKKLTQNLEFTFGLTAFF